MREIRYRKIADDLRVQIMAGEFAPGAVLPSETELGVIYEASRVTIRKALNVLRDERLVGSKQGFGWFVDGGTVRQSLGELGTIEGQLRRQGKRSRRQVVSFRFVAADPHAVEVLGVETVLEVVRVNFADEVPFAHVTVWCPEALGAGLSRDDVETSTFHDLLDVTFGGATQTIGAALATDDVAAALNVPAGSPMLVCERISRDDQGVARLLAIHRFPAHLTEFAVELTTVETSIAPSGLRLTQD